MSFPKKNTLGRPVKRGVGAIQYATPLVSGATDYSDAGFTFVQQSATVIRCTIPCASLKRGADNGGFLRWTLASLLPESGDGVYRVRLMVTGASGSGGPGIGIGLCTVEGTRGATVASAIGVFDSSGNLFPVYINSTTLGFGASGPALPVTDEVVEITIIRKGAAIAYALAVGAVGNARAYNYADADALCLVTNVNATDASSRTIDVAIQIAKVGDPA